MTPVNYHVRVRPALSTTGFGRRLFVSGDSAPLEFVPQFATMLVALTHPETSEIMVFSRLMDFHLALLQRRVS